MKTGGFTRTAVLGMVAAALLLAGGCRDERRGQQDVQGQQQAPGTGGAGQDGTQQQQPEELNRLPDEEGFQSTPEQQELPSGIGQDGRGGSEVDEQR